MPRAAEGRDAADGRGVELLRKWCREKQDLVVSLWGTNTNESLRQAIRTTIFSMLIVALGLTFGLRSNANWVCCEGDRWLHWDKKTRSLYVEAYTKGAIHGYYRGCGKGITSSAEATLGDDFLAASKRCNAKAPITNRDPRNFSIQITKFYLKYPARRFLRISDLVLSLYAGKTLEQIHKEFPRGS